MLIEDNPGVGKTALARALARSVEAEYARVQCTADLLPADVVGTNVFNQRENRFEFRPGPVFANVVLVDEINRASPKTQSGLLECMQERHVTVDVHTHELARPFIVLATQNPVEYEGTYPLPEAQLDRFMVRVSLGYPRPGGRGGDARRARGRRPRARRSSRSRRSPEVLAAQARRGARSRERVRCAATSSRCSSATRADPRTELGASPRAGLMLLKAAKALAALDARDHVLPDDVQALAPSVLTHRLLVAPEAASADRAEHRPRRARARPGALRRALARSRTRRRAQRAPRRLRLAVAVRAGARAARARSGSRSPGSTLVRARIARYAGATTPPRSRRASPTRSSCSCAAARSRHPPASCAIRLLDAPAAAAPRRAARLRAERDPRRGAAGTRSSRRPSCVRGPARARRAQGALASPGEVLVLPRVERLARRPGGGGRRARARDRTLGGGRRGARARRAAPVPPGRARLAHPLAGRRPSRRADGAALRRRPRCQARSSSSTRARPASEPALDQRAASRRVALRALRAASAAARCCCRATVERRRSSPTCARGRRSTHASRWSSRSSG